MSALTRALKRLHDDEAGAMSVEKILLVALIALPIIIVLVFFRDTIMGWFDTQAGQLHQEGGGGEQEQERPWQQDSGGVGGGGGGGPAFEM